MIVNSHSSVCVKPRYEGSCCTKATCQPHVSLLHPLPNRLPPTLTWPVSPRYVSPSHTFTVIAGHVPSYYADYHHHHLPQLSLLYLSLSLFLPIIIIIMDFIRASPNEHDRMVKIELEAAEALAGLARVPAAKTISRGCESVAERVKGESNDRNSSSGNSYEVATNFMPKKSEKPGVLTAKSIKDEHNTDLRLNPVHPTNCVTSGRKSRQNLTEAEMEARKIRRVLANRESARQTIRRRQAVFEELTRKAVNLSWENENLKREKETVSKQFDSLKAKNECLKTQMKIITNEAKETREESITMNEPSISASSTNSPFYNCIQPSFVPVVWPNSLQLQCGPPARIVLPSHMPISPSHASKPDSSCEASSMTVNRSVNGPGSGTPLYLLPYPWLFTLPQNNNENHHRTRCFNLNDKPKESCECQQLFPVSDGFPPDGGGRPTTNLVSCEELLIEHDDTNKVGDNKQVVGVIHKVPVVCSGKRLGDMVAAAEARRRRKQVTRLKNHAHCRQLQMH